MLLNGIYEHFRDLTKKIENQRLIVMIPILSEKMQIFATDAVYGIKFAVLEV